MTALLVGVEVVEEDATKLPTGSYILTPTLFTSLTPAESGDVEIAAHMTPYCSLGCTLAGTTILTSASICECGAMSSSLGVTEVQEVNSLVTPTSDGEKSPFSLVAAPG